MLPDDAFLRRLPASFAPAERYRVEAIVFSADVMNAALHRIRQTALLHGPAPNLNTLERSQLFADAWTIVDQIHVLRQLYLTGSWKLGPKSSAFVENYESAQRLRNKMDHIHSNLKNMAKSKGNRPPLFGALSYLLVPDEFLSLVNGETKVVGAYSISMIAGASGNHSMWKVVGGDNSVVRIPVGQIALEAFDDTIILDNAVEEFGSILIHFNDGLEKDLTDQLTAHAAANGVSLEELLKPSGGNVIVSATISFVDPDNVENPSSDNAR